MALRQRIDSLELLVLGTPVFLTSLGAFFRILDGLPLLLDGFVYAGEKVLVVEQDVRCDPLHGGFTQALGVFASVVFQHCKPAALAVFCRNQSAQFAGRFVGAILHHIEDGLEGERLGHCSLEEGLEGCCAGREVGLFGQLLLEELFHAWVKLDRLVQHRIGAG